MYSIVGYVLVGLVFFFGFKGLGDPETAFPKPPFRENTTFKITEPQRYKPRDTTQKEQIKRLEEYIKLHTLPSYLRTDNLPEGFSMEEIDEKMHFNTTDLPKYTAKNKLEIALPKTYERIFWGRTFLLTHLYHRDNIIPLTSQEPYYLTQYLPEGSSKETAKDIYKIHHFTITKNLQQNIETVYIHSTHEKINQYTFECNYVLKYNLDGTLAYIFAYDRSKNSNLTLDWYGFHYDNEHKFTQIDEYTLTEVGAEQISTTNYSKIYQIIPKN